MMKTDNGQPHTHNHGSNIGYGQNIQLQLAQQHWRGLQDEAAKAQVLHTAFGSWRHRLAAWLYALANQIDDWSSEQHDNLRTQARNARQQVRQRIGGGISNNISKADQKHFF
jgi:hypothetical protein